MRKFDSSSAVSNTVGPLDVARWEQYGLDSMMPFGAMWYSVPAGQSSLRDCHPERELSIVISGTASVEVDGAVTDMPTGSAFLFDAEEAHVIHNRDQDAPLTIFSAYWLPGGSTGVDPLQVSASAPTAERADV